LPVDDCRLDFIFVVRGPDFRATNNTFDRIDIYANADGHAGRFLNADAG
jgi:hypothetical protein